MGNNIEIFSFIIPVLVLIYLIFKINKYQSNDQYISELISDHYENKKMNVEGISKLSFPEKIKYGVPVSPIFTIYRNSFGILNQESSYARRVELMDEDKNTYTKYIELIMKSGALIFFNEFDSYDI